MQQNCARTYNNFNSSTPRLSLILPSQRLSTISPSQRLSTISPSQRLSTISPSQCCQRQPTISIACYVESASSSRLVGSFLLGGEYSEYASDRSGPNNMPARTYLSHWILSKKTHVLTHIRVPTHVNRIPAATAVVISQALNVQHMFFFLAAQQ